MVAFVFVAFVCLLVSFCCVPAQADDGGGDSGGSSSSGNGGACHISINNIINIRTISQSGKFCNITGRLGESTG